MTKELIRARGYQFVVLRNYRLTTKVASELPRPTRGQQRVKRAQNDAEE